jgi:hypothetical protein
MTNSESDTGKTEIPFPISAYAPIALERPLLAFGSQFKVHVSTKLTLSPDTVLQAVIGSSLQTLLRTKASGKHQLVKKLLYIAAGKHRASEGTKKLLRDEFSKVLPIHDLNVLLDGIALEKQTPAGSDWGAVLKGLQVNGAREGEPFYDIASHAANLDKQLLQIHDLVRNEDRVEAEARIRLILGPGAIAWQSLNAGLPHNTVLPLIETALDTFAWLECKISAELRLDSQNESRVTALLEPGYRPIGHWLQEVREAAGCKNLEHLSKRLSAKEAKHLGRDISYDLLKKWSSSTKTVMPAAAVQSVLRVIPIKKSFNLLKDRYYVARFFTFLCDLVQAATQGRAPSLEEAQRQIKARYNDVYRAKSCQSLIDA